MRRLRLAVAGVVAVPLALAACADLGSGVTGGTGRSGVPADLSSTAPGPTSGVPSPSPSPGSGEAPDFEPDLDLALSEPAEDSYYPEVGDPSVDALHYDLTLGWNPGTDTLVGFQSLTFRATATADRFQLDLGEPLEVTALTLDGVEVPHEHDGKDLVVRAPVVADERYVLAVEYTGTPEPVEAPSERSDMSTLGFTIDDQHQTWTMQEPFGAYTYYAVNDQPSDKALYDFALVVPTPWTGIANGAQVDDETTDDGTMRTTRYHLAEPAASYLVTVAFGDYQRTDDTGPGGVPITYWTPRGVQPTDGMRYSPDAMRWLEERLGPYPFDTAGILVVDSESGMETQTMITLGNTEYSTSAATVVHEFAHQWYGDQVTPDDWRDVWMNEGMAMYLQLMWEAEQDEMPLEEMLEIYAPQERMYRLQHGPPGAFDAGEFGSSNVYLSGAFLWHALRKQVGDDVFWDAVRGWPLAQDNTSTDRETLLAYLEEATGEQLDDLWNGWLLGEDSPPFP